MRNLLDNLGKLVVVLVMLMVAAAWWWVPVPSARRVQPASAEAWSLPLVVRTKPERALETILLTSLWGKPPAQSPVDAPLNTPEWRFAGITVNGAERYVLISVDGQPTQTLKVGDALPGGAKILVIHEDSLSLSINGKKRNLDISQ